MNNLSKFSFRAKVGFRVGYVFRIYFLVDEIWGGFRGFWGWGRRIEVVGIFRIGDGVVVKC